MFRSVRVLVIAAIIAASLAIGGSIASADTITVPVTTAKPTLIYGITWE